MKSSIPGTLLFWQWDWCGEGGALIYLPLFVFWKYVKLPAEIVLVNYTVFIPIFKFICFELRKTNPLEFHKFHYNLCGTYKCYLLYEKRVFADVTEDCEMECYAGLSGHA